MIFLPNLIDAGIEVSFSLCTVTAQEAWGGKKKNLYLYKNTENVSKKTKTQVVWVFLLIVLNRSGH